MVDTEVTIIGGGVVGLSIFSEITSVTDDVYLIEKNERLAMETSSRNSGVIHSGIHYKPGSLKAKLCIEGNRMLYNISAQNGIPYRKTGKLTVATTEDEIILLKGLYENGIRNGVQGMEFLEPDEIEKIQPGIRAELGLYTPSSGIIDPIELSNYFYSKGLANGGTVILSSTVNSIKLEGGSYRISGISHDKKFSFTSKYVVNSAGLNAHLIAKEVGLDIDALGYNIEYFKGDYFRVEGGRPVNMPIYPLPEQYGLGIHMTPDISGIVRLGPNSYKVDTIDYRVQSDKFDFLKNVERYFPSIKNYEIVDEFSGIRPKLKNGKDDFNDFIIKEESENGFPNFINLIGIESPGLTSSPAIGKYVRDIYLSTQ